MGIDHVTAVLLLTVGVNCCVWPPPRAAVGGATDTVIGGASVIVAVANLVVSAWLVAVTVTVCCVVMLAGAVYRPVALIVPGAFEGIDQITPVLLEFVTGAENCWPCPP